VRLGLNYAFLLRITRLFALIRSYFLLHFHDFLLTFLLTSICDFPKEFECPEVGRSTIFPKNRCFSAERFFDRFWGVFLTILLTILLTL
jgi:hypothetical protein